MKNLLTSLAILIFCLNASAQLTVGCMDQNACNFNADATVELLNSCVYNGWFSENWEPTFPVEACSGERLLNSECVEHIYDLYGEWCEDCWSYYELCLDIDLQQAFIIGCTNENACNYNPLANVHNEESCDYGVYYAMNYNPDEDDTYETLLQTCDFILTGGGFSGGGFSSPDITPSYDAIRLYSEACVEYVIGPDRLWTEQSLENYNLCNQADRCHDINACNYELSGVHNPALCRYAVLNDLCSGAIPLPVNDLFYDEANGSFCNPQFLDVPSIQEDSENGWVLAEFHGIEGEYNDRFYTIQSSAEPKTFFFSFILDYNNPAFFSSLNYALFSECGGNLLTYGRGDLIDESSEPYVTFSINSELLEPSTEYVLAIVPQERGNFKYKINYKELEPSPCPGDFNSDGAVNVGDLGGFLAAFGSSCTN